MSIIGTLTLGESTLKFRLTEEDAETFHGVIMGDCINRLFYKPDGWTFQPDLPDVPTGLYQVETQRINSSPIEHAVTYRVHEGGVWLNALNNHRLKPEDVEAILTAYDDDRLYRLVREAVEVVG